MKLAINPIGQRDTKWNRKYLGNSTTTIGAYGCLLCCHAMMLAYYGHEMTPDVLNNVYKEKGVFDGNLINFWSAGNVFGDVKAVEYYNCIDTPADLAKVDACLAKKQPVIAWVDNVNNDKTPDHFILIIGKDDNGSYFINDPWEGETYYFQAKYGEPDKGIYGLRIYEGKTPVEVNYQDAINDLTSKLTSCNTALAEKLLEANRLLADLQEQERDNSDITKQLLEARNKRDQETWRADSAETTSKALSAEVDNLETKIEALNLQVTTLQKDSIAGLTKWQLLKLTLDCFLKGGVKNDKG